MRTLAKIGYVCVNACLILLIGILLAGCNKEMEGTLFKVYDDKMIDEVMVLDPSLSLFLQIIDKAELRGTIHAYGNYTLFVPNDAGVTNYLSEINRDIASLTKDEAAKIVKYHLIKDTIATTDFIDGRLESPTFLNNFLTTKTVNDNGDVYTIVNRQARLLEKNIRTSNGYIHIIDNVLVPPPKTVLETIDALPDDKYSIMKALVNKYAVFPESVPWFTFFIEENSYFESINVTNAATLLPHLKVNRPDVFNDSVLLSDFVNYHIIYGLNYVADLIKLSNSSYLTAVSGKAIIFKRDLDKLLLNEFIQNGILLEKGVLLNRESYYTDLSCSNGVLHSIDGIIEIKKRKAYRVYWDMAEQPEIMTMKSFRKPNASATFFPGELSGVQWGGRSGAPLDVSYYCHDIYATWDPKTQRAFGDHMRFKMSATSGISWMEWKLPPLMAGDYKVWVCWRRESTITVKAIFKQDGYEDQVLPYVFSMAEYFAAGNSNEQNLLEGWKQYNSKEGNSVINSRLLGTIKVEVDGTHTLRFESLNTVQYYQSWDMIQFIPIDEDQIWPRIDNRGVLVYEDTPVCEYWPFRPGIDTPCPADTTAGN